MRSAFLVPQGSFVLESIIYLKMGKYQSWLSGSLAPCYEFYLSNLTKVKYSLSLSLHISSPLPLETEFTS